jgi:hypothetical protein
MDVLFRAVSAFRIVPRFNIKAEMHIKTHGIKGSVALAIV